MAESSSLKKTPLTDRHVALGAKIVDFSGWAMPVYYSSIIAEHQWVRRSCGIFDVSHLGEIRVSGEGAFAFLQARLTNDMNKLRDGKILYHLICDELGMTLDDILVYQAKPDDFYLIVNAGNIERDFQALEKYVPDSVKLENHSDQMACIAAQGPRSEEVMKRVLGLDLSSLGYYHFREEQWNGSPVWVSRSGYTGEDGFEIFSQNDLAPAIWDRLMDSAPSEGILPAGLGARNTLRLEAGNVLYGHELDTQTTPLEAGLQWAVSFDKGSFVGRDGMLIQKDKGLRKKLIGFRMLDKSVAREHYPVYQGERKIGGVTSGSYGPTVGGSIGMAFVVKGSSEEPGTRMDIEIHGRRAPAEIVKLPFVPMKHKNRPKAEG
ncbi:MAG: glycine cleavage system aminomethyltransferase GcvT [Candidatus Omnitrophica bacterium]|nr:glycine cleavage system aminomethyltransferase GcvT [Candidatus Omnitrophota bacterium]